MTENVKLVKVIRSTSEIKQLVKEINLRSTGKVNPVKLEIEWLTSEKNKELTQQLQTLYAACGCAQGRTSGVIALVLFVVLVLTDVVPINELGTLKTMLLFFVVAVVVMFFGKVYGLITGRKALMKFANEVEQMKP